MLHSCITWPVPRKSHLVQEQSGLVLFPLGLMSLRWNSRVTSSNGSAKTKMLSCSFLCSVQRCPVCIHTVLSAVCSLPAAAAAAGRLVSCCRPEDQKKVGYDGWAASSSCAPVSLSLGVRYQRHTDFTFHFSHQKNKKTTSSNPGYCAVSPRTFSQFVWWSVSLKLWWVSDTFSMWAHITIKRCGLWMNTRTFNHCVPVR